MMQVLSYLYLLILYLLHYCTVCPVVFVCNDLSAVWVGLVRVINWAFVSFMSAG